MSRVLTSLLGFLASLGGATGFAAEMPATTLPPFLVTATRLPQDPGQTAATVDAISADHLAHRPGLALDDALRGAAAFSLFRRSNSITANPTAQGVSLRGLGPSGASRSLVLLDGIPLNDPFGGWIAWSKVPRLTLNHAEIVRGGGSGAWGNAALGGTVQLFNAPPRVDAAQGTLAIEIADLGTARGEFIAQQPAGDSSSWQIGGRWFHTDGPMQYAPDQRGPVDRRLDSEHALAHGGFSTTLDSGLVLSVHGRWFDEERGNGTPLQRNSSREQTAHARLSGSIQPGLNLDVLAYAQRQHFASGFSSVNDQRTAETPALDQYDVPASAWGMAVVTTFGDHPAATTAIGADVRAVSGETRENFFLSNGSFTRRRFAGGDQIIGGIFVAHQHHLASDLTAQLTTRVDHWRNTDGHRRESVIASGAVTRDESFADSSNTEFSPMLGLAWRAAEAMTWRASVYHAFRVPTLNELYRPFRVGNVATEANPALQPETVIGGEVGFEFTQQAWRVRANVFQNDLHDGVANVTLSTTPALTQRQRLNLDAVRVRGFEAALGWRPHAAFDLGVDFLLVDARVRKADVAPDLVGQRLAQVPGSTVTLRASWHPAATWRVDVGVRALARQFEDDANTLPLAAATTVDLAIRHTTGDGHEVYLAADNLLDERVETARSESDLVAFAPGRWIRAGWILHW